MAAPRRVVELAFGREDGGIGAACAFANGAGEPGRAGAHAARLSGDAVVLRGGTGDRRDASDRRAMRAAGRRFGVMAALDDSPRPGKEPIITDEARTFVVDLACRKAKDLGYPHELWTTRLLARHVREHGPRGGARLPRRARSGHGVQDPRPHTRSSRTRCATTSNAATRSSTQKMAEVLCVYREVEC